MQLGDRLSELRKTHGYTQKQLAELVNCSQQVISNIERNESSADIEFLQKLADLYKISLDDVVGRKNIYPQNESYEEMILNVVETMDEKKKELSLKLISDVAQHGNEKNGN